MKTLQKLSQHQLDFFDTFGYLAFPGLLNDCIDKSLQNLKMFGQNQEELMMKPKDPH